MVKFKTYEQAQEYVQRLTISEVQRLLIELLVEPEQEKRISITEGQLRAFFKIVGRTDAGTEERRGRPRKTAPEDATLL